MKLSDGIQQAYAKKWAMINTFSVQIDMPPFLLGEVGGFERDLDLHIVSVNTPDFQNDPIESFIANRWFIQNGADALYRFSITFRDHDNMALYRKFLAVYNLVKENYFDNVSLNVIITKEEDWYGQGDSPLMSLGGTLVEGVSNLSFSNDTENQIAEFTVNFKCNNPSIVSGKSGGSSLLGRAAGALR